MKLTTNYNLYKPDYDDTIDVNYLNQNMDIIDNQLRKAGDIDLSAYALKKDYLPLKGGTMTGNIKLSDMIGLVFGTKGCLNFTTDANKETLNMTADVLKCMIAGKPFVIDNKSITYDGNYLVTAENGNNFVKLSNGLIFQWGFFYINDKMKTFTITLPTPMSTNNYVVACTRDTLSNTDANVTGDVFGDYRYTYNHTLTNFKISISQTRTKTPYSWLAVGGI